MGSDGDPVFTVEGIDHDIEELRQTLAVTHHPDSITLLWTRIDRLLDRRKRLTDALSGVPLEK